ncbi:MAG: hypothetical protein K2X01_07775 [Cyanobacteria bacterium]|nr:hypothetical protein [Cyanobacteriota bacterium]
MSSVGFTTAGAYGSPYQGLGTSGAKSKQAMRTGINIYSIAASGAGTPVKQHKGDSGGDLGLNDTDDGGDY